MRTALQAGDFDRYYERNLAFHDVFLDRCDNSGSCGWCGRSSSGSTTGRAVAASSRRGSSPPSASTRRSPASSRSGDARGGRRSPPRRALVVRRSGALHRAVLLRGRGARPRREPAREGRGDPPGGSSTCSATPCTTARASAPRSSSRAAPLAACGATTPRASRSRPSCWSPRRAACRCGTCATVCAHGAPPPGSAAVHRLRRVRRGVPGRRAAARRPRDDGGRGSGEVLRDRVFYDESGEASRSPAASRSPSPTSSTALLDALPRGRVHTAVDTWASRRGAPPRARPARRPLPLRREARGRRAPPLAHRAAGRAHPRRTCGPSPSPRRPSGSACRSSPASHGRRGRPRGDGRPAWPACRASAASSLLPYHRTGVPKARRLGREYAADASPRRPRSDSRPSPRSSATAGLTCNRSLPMNPRTEALRRSQPRHPALDLGRAGASSSPASTARTTAAGPSR